MATATVLQLSDTHFTEHARGRVNGVDPAARLTAVLEAWVATGEHADLVVHTGDIADDGSVGACRRVAAALGTLGAPLLAVAGNHDMGEAVTAVFGATVAEVGTWRVVGLASEWPGRTEGALDAPGALALLDGLDDRPTVLAVHHPPQGPSTHRWFQLHGAGELLDGLAARPQVRAVISGHLHEAFDFVGPGGLALLGGPSTLYALHHEGERWARSDVAPTGARVLRLGDDGTLDTDVVVA
jgi:Icc protein